MRSTFFTGASQPPDDHRDQNPNQLQQQSSNVTSDTTHAPRGPPPRPPRPSLPSVYLASRFQNLQSNTTQPNSDTRFPQSETTTSVITSQIQVDDITNDHKNINSRSSLVDLNVQNDENLCSNTDQLPIPSEQNHSGQSSLASFHSVSAQLDNLENQDHYQASIHENLPQIQRQPNSIVENSSQSILVSESQIQSKPRIQSHSQFENLSDIQSRSTTQWQTHSRGDENQLQPQFSNLNQSPVHGQDQSQFEKSQSRHDTLSQSHSIDNENQNKAETLKSEDISQCQAHAGFKFATGTYSKDPDQMMSNEAPQPTFENEISFSTEQPVIAGSSSMGSNLHNENQHRKAPKVNLNNSGQKRLEQREAIIMELIQSERDYLRVLKKTRDIFFGDRVNAKLIGVDLDQAFGNLDEVIDFGEDLLVNLELNNMSKYDRDKCIGLCFIDSIDKFQQVYGDYCREFNSVNEWHACEQSVPVRAYMEGKLEELKDVTDCFNIQTILIKPVQRLAKYPLLLHELNSVTEQDHPDKKNLEKSLKLVTNAVRSINQLMTTGSGHLGSNKKASRSSFLNFGSTSGPASGFGSISVFPSSSGRVNSRSIDHLPLSSSNLESQGGQIQDKPFMDWLSSKMSLHSLKKKTSRLSTRFAATLGLGQPPRDEEFERLHESHKNLRKTIRCFLKELQSFLEHLEAFLMSLQKTTQSINLFYQSEQKNVSVKNLNGNINDKLIMKNKNCIDQHHHEFKRLVDRQVITTINQLLSKFVGPATLITKRYDKLLDYDSKTRKLESCKNLEKRQLLREHQIKAKELYDRLNSQLIQELPLFNSSALEIFQDCLIIFLKARRQFISRYTQELVQLLENHHTSQGFHGQGHNAPLLAFNSGFEDQEGGQGENSLSDIVERFNQRHSNEIMRIFDRDRLLPASILMNSSSQIKQQQSSQSKSFQGHNLHVQKDHGRNVDNFTNETRAFVYAQSSIGFRSSSPLCSTPEEFMHLPSSDHDHDRRSVSVASTQSSGVGGAVISTDLRDLAASSTDSNEHGHIVNAVVGQSVDSATRGRSNSALDSHNSGSSLHLSAGTSGRSGSISGSMSAGASSSKLHSGSNVPPQIFVASWPFTASESNRLNLAFGQHVFMIKNCDERGNDEWSLVQDRAGQCGYVPSSYIKPLQ